MKRPSRPSKPKPAQPQLSFDFEVVSNRQNRIEIVPAAKIEVLPPAPVEADLAEPNRYLEGAEENKYLLHQADKYEGRAFYVLVLLMTACGFAVLVKSGLPLPKPLLEKYGVPPVQDMRLLSGILGIATFIFSATLAYCVIQNRAHSPQLQFRFVQRTWPKQLSRAILAISALLVIAMILAVMTLTYKDIWHLVTFVWDRQIYTLDGWDPVATKPAPK